MLNWSYKLTELERKIDETVQLSETIDFANRFVKTDHKTDQVVSSKYIVASSKHTVTSIQDVNSRVAKVHPV